MRVRINDIHGIAQPLGLARLILNVKQLTRERYSINIKVAILHNKRTSVTIIDSCTRMTIPLQGSILRIEGH